MQIITKGALFENRAAAIIANAMSNAMPKADPATMTAEQVFDWIEAHPAEIAEEFARDVFDYQSAEEWHAAIKEEQA